MTESPFTESHYKSRRKKLLKELATQKLDAFLVYAPVNVRYLTGFSGDSSILLLSPKKCLLITDGRFTTQLAEECPELEIDVRPVTETLPFRVSKILESFKFKSVGYESHRMTVDFFHSLGSLIHEPMVNLVEKLRAIKDKQEIAEIKKAIDIAQKAFQATRFSLDPQMTEIDVRNLLEGTMRNLGAETAAFETIVGAGPTAALPHAHPGLQKIGQHHHLLIDWGAKLSTGYCSDMTRVLLLGKLPAKIKTIYQVVSDALEAAIEQIKPGVACSQVDKAARSLIKKRKYGAYFNHGLGHSFGMEVHETIRFSPNSNQILEPGMMMTVEPGIYLDGYGGVRLEENLIVTETGFERLSTLTTDISEMMIDI